MFSSATHFAGTLGTPASVAAFIQAVRLAAANAWDGSGWKRGPRGAWAIDAIMASMAAKSKLPMGLFMRTASE